MRLTFLALLAFLSYVAALVISEDSIADGSVDVFDDVDATEPTDLTTNFGASYDMPDIGLESTDGPDAVDDLEPVNDFENTDELGTDDESEDLDTSTTPPFEYGQNLAVDGATIISSISAVAGNITENCSNICSPILSAASICGKADDDSDSDSDDAEAKCLCTDANVGLLNQCLGCIVSNTTFPADVLNTLQKGLDGVANECKNAGYPVSSITPSTATEAPTSTDLPATTTAGSAPATTTTSPSTSPPSPTLSSGAIRGVKIEAGVVFALVSTFAGAFFL